MRVFVGAIMLCLAAWGQNPRTTPGDVAAGQAIYRSHCAECHGFTGQGGRGPNLTTGVFYHGSSDEELFRNITDGITGTPMPGQFFSSDQIWQVVAYVRSISKPGSAKAPPGNAKAGEAVFAKQGCGGCHMVRGTGGVMGPDLTFAGSQRTVDFLRASIVEPDGFVEPEYKTARIVMENGDRYEGLVLNEDTYYVQLLSMQKGLVTAARRNFREYAPSKKSAMPSYKGKIGDKDLDDLLAYLWSLQRPGRKQ